jgi:hypothetical protein
MSKQVHFDTVSFLMAFEAGEIEEDEIVRGFQTLIDSGVINSLQGVYGRTAKELIDNGHCTAAQPRQTKTLEAPMYDVGPFVKVSRDKKRTYEENGRTLRFVLYGAYNAMGLIGPESNGIAVLDEDNKQVITDEMGKISSGYYGPSQAQIDLFNSILKMDFSAMCEVVNASPRLRHELDGGSPGMSI